MRAIAILFATSALAAAAPAHAGSCDAACLIKLADRTMAAIAAKDYRSLPWADPVRYSENNVPLMIGDAWWGSAGATVGKKAFALADPETGNIVWFGTIWDHDAPAFGAVRIKAPDGKIAELEVVAARKPWPVPYADPAMFAMSTPGRPIKADDQRSRERLIDIADTYLATKQRNNGALLADFAPGCAMRENGTPLTSAELDVQPQPADCASAFRVGLFTPVERIRDRRFPAVDTQRGLVVAISVQDLPARSETVQTADGKAAGLKRPYPMSRLVVELVRIEGDKVMSADGVAASLPYRMPTPWTSSAKP